MSENIRQLVLGAKTGIVDPTIVIPDFIGQLYINTITDKIFFAKSTSQGDYELLTNFINLIASNITTDTSGQTIQDILNSLEADSHAHANETELDLIIDGDHDARVDNPHGVDKIDVGLENVPDLNTTDAVNKAHNQNSDIKLDDGQPNEVTSSEIRTHLDDLTKHRLIDDGISTTINLYSASNIDTLISASTSNLDIKDSVVTVADTNVTLSGEQTINGVLTSASRVGVVGQTLSEENGIYVTSSGAWTRSTDADVDSEVTNGLSFFVSNSGSTKNGNQYILITPDPLVLDTTGLTFIEVPRIVLGTTSGTATEGDDPRIPTQDENDALVGTSGTPSSANKYATDQDARLHNQNTDTTLTTNGVIELFNAGILKRNLLADDSFNIQIDEIRARDLDGLKLFDDGGNGIFVKDGGNVGIGTSTPGAKLDVIGDVNISTDYNIGGIEVLSSTTLGNNIVNSSLTNLGTLTGLIMGSTSLLQFVQGAKIKFTGGTGNNFIEGNVSNTGRIGISTENVERISILLGGNVGIGIINPTEKLQVNGNIKTAGYIDFGVISSVPDQEGRVYYDTDDKALSLKTDIVGSIQSLGQEFWIRVINKTGISIPDGSVVFISGFDVSSGRPTIALAKADVVLNANAIGFTTNTMVNNAEGFVTAMGFLNDLDTSSFVTGDELFLSDTIAGAVTATKPLISVPVGFATKIDTVNGQILTSIARRITDSPIFAQLSDSVSQKPTVTTPIVITFNTNNNIRGITHSVINATEDIIFDFDGTYTILAQPQIEKTSGGGTTSFHMWARIGLDDKGTTTFVSIANPSVITTTDPHGLTTGQIVEISNTSTTPDINAQHVIIVTGANTFTIPVNVTIVTDGTGNWRRILDINDDLPNSNTELNLTGSTDSSIIPLIFTKDFIAGQKLNIMQSISNTGLGVGLVAKTPSGEPLIPSIIFTINKN